MFLRHPFLLELFNFDLLVGEEEARYLSDTSEDVSDHVHIHIPGATAAQEWESGDEQHIYSHWMKCPVNRIGSVGYMLWRIFQ